MPGAEREVAAHAVGMLEAEREAEDGPDVVRDEVDAVDVEGVQEGDDVGEHLLPGVPTRGRRRPSRAAQVRTDHAMVLGQAGDDLAPLPPVLGEAVQQQDRWAVPRLRDVHAQTGELREPVGDPVENREGVHPPTVLRT